MHKHTHASTHTHTHTHTHSHTYLNFAIFWKDHEIKYTSNWDNTGPQNLIHPKFKFFNKNFRSNKYSEQIEVFALSEQNDWKMQDEEDHF